MIDKLVAHELAPGIAFAIVRGDQVIYRRDAGWADCKAQRCVDAGTVFSTAPVTKPFTALATTLMDRNGVLEATAEVYDGVQHRIRVELEPGHGQALTFAVVDGRPVSVEYLGVRFLRLP